jgi:ketosteroid isomerase-like protein
MATLSRLRRFIRETIGARHLGPAVLIGAVAAAPLAAQIPGDELPSQSRVRNEYLVTTYAEVKQLLAEWQENHRNGDAAKLAKLFTTDGLYSPIDGWYVQGRQAVADTMAKRVTVVRGYHASLIDFTASGGLAYYLGRMSYHIDKGTGLDVAGTFVMVLYLDGRHWRIRSYVERLSSES